RSTTHLSLLTPSPPPTLSTLPYTTLFRSPADPDHRDETIDLDLHRRLAAVSREVTEHQIEIFLEADPVVDAGDGTALLRVVLLGGLHDGGMPTVGDGERADDPGVVRFLCGVQTIEADVVPAETRGLAHLQCRLRLHRPCLGARHPDRDDEDTEVDDEASVAPVVTGEQTSHRGEDRFTHTEAGPRRPPEAESDGGGDEERERERED